VWRTVGGEAMSAAMEEISSGVDMAAPSKIG
jgi:hypothetical protein